MLTPTLQNCDFTEDAFFRCVDQLFDTDHNQIITVLELNNFFDAPSAYSAGLNTHIVMTAGDYNHDNVLDMNDWNSPNRTIFYKEHNTKLYTCFFCRQNHVNMDAPLKK
jgi:hypothetical protein